MLFTDFVLNEGVQGPVGEVFNNVRGEVRFDPGLYRPYLGRDNHPMVTVNTGRTVMDNRTGKYKAVYQPMRIDDLRNRYGINVPVANATSLRKEDWVELDRVIIRAARQRLRAWADLASRNSFGGFNGMAKLTLEYEAMGDPGSAQIDFDGLSVGRGDSPLFKLRSLPLPITHSDFSFSSRRLAVSRNSTTPLDATMAEAAARRVAETIEQMLIGTLTGPTYGTVSSITGPGSAHDGTSTVYGYTTYTNRLTKTNVTTPTGSNPEVTVADVLAMRQQLYAAKFYGPYMIYHSTDWDLYLDNDYARLGGNNASMTLRDRLRKIDGVEDVRRLDFLSSTFTMIMVQMTPDVVRAVNGMDLSTIQWETKGGMELNFKVMCIQVPQIRSDYSGNCGLLHATTS